MTLGKIAIKKIILKLLRGEDYRVEVVTLIDAEFLQGAIDFFKRVVDAKLKNKSVTVDWYKKELLNANLSKEEIAIHSGMNMKTISNMYNSATKEIVLDASLQHYEELGAVIEELVEQDDVALTLTIKFRGVSVDLNVSESLIVINTLAVMRAALRGGLWSTAGKQVEKQLMTSLCALLRVPKKHFDQSRLPASLREVDFYLIGPQNEYHRCEVKLMGKGNPESADGALARDSKVFVADKLSVTNKTQLDQRGILWVELRGADGLNRFCQVLGTLGIPCKPFKGNLEKAAAKVLTTILPDSENVSFSGVRESASEYLVDFTSEELF
jgi:hypothetical protein